MSIRVTILGSGTIIPSPERRSTALLVEAGTGLYLLDCGPCALNALEEAGTSFRELEKVFITHLHPDHTLGLGHLLAALRNDPVSGGKDKLTFYGPRGLVDLMEKWNRLYKSTVPRGEYLELVEVSDGDVDAGGDVNVSAVGVEHGDCKALAYRLEFRGISVVYTGDSTYTEALVELAKDADLLVSECSFPDTHPAAGHMTPGQVGRLASRSGARRVVLVHLYPVFEGIDPVRGVREYYHGPVDVARDGMEINI